MGGALIPLGLFFHRVWVPAAPRIRGGQVPLLVCFMGVVLIFDLLRTLVVMNWTALFPQMIPGPRDRAGVSGRRQSFSVLGLLVGVALPPRSSARPCSPRGAAVRFAGSWCPISARSLSPSRSRPPSRSGPSTCS
jgi:GPH family glycoside/pentoside/hexuronide:cation symporter